MIKAQIADREIRQGKNGYEYCPFGLVGQAHFTSSFFHIDSNLSILADLEQESTERTEVLVLC